MKILKVDLVNRPRVAGGSSSLRRTRGTPSTSSITWARRWMARLRASRTSARSSSSSRVVEGLIPISEMSWTQRIHHPKDVLKVGGQRAGGDPGSQRRKAKDQPEPEGSRSGSLAGYRRPVSAGDGDQWTDYAHDRFRGLRATGRGSGRADSHFAVGGPSGSERSARIVPEVGKVLPVRILAVDPQQRRISLSLKGIGGAEPASAEEPMAEPAAAPKKKERRKPLRGGLSW